MLIIDSSRQAHSRHRLVLIGAFLLTLGGLAAVSQATPTAAQAAPPACTIMGTSDADVLVGTPGDDVICGFEGADTIEGRGGNDYIIGGPGDDLLAGNAGNDEIYGHAGEDRLFGGPGSDIVAGGGSDDLVRGGSGDDELHGGAGSDRLIGGDGDDDLWGGSGADSLAGRAGDDTLYGGSGNDVLSGNKGSNFLYGQAGQDTLNGGPDFDLLAGGGDDDILKSGGGASDLLYGEQGNDQLVAGNGDDYLFGGGGGDLLEGRAGADELHGGAGNDVVAGNSGDDILRGNGGDDDVFGGPGTDDCNGGPGSDTLVSCEVLPWIQVGEDIDGEIERDQSGYSVAMSNDGKTVAIGAPYNDANGETSGQVRVYELDGGTWSQVGSDIDGDSGGAGLSVALSHDANTVVVGARLHCCDDTYPNHTRVYRFDGLDWVQLGDDIPGEAADLSALSVATSGDGNRIIIGAEYNDGNGHQAGHSRVYRLEGSAWTQMGTDIDGEAAGDRSGTSVAMSSDGVTVAAGGPGNDGNGQESGHVRVFEFDGSEWVQLGADIDGSARLVRSGRSVALDSQGSTVAVSAATGTSVYRLDGGAWSQIGSAIETEDVSEWVSSLAISSMGDIVVIGASVNDGRATDAGHARVFAYDGASWNQVGADIDGETIGDHSGFSVAINGAGDSVIVGAPLNDGNGMFSGHARVFVMP